MSNKSIERRQNAYRPPPQNYERWYSLGGAWVMVNGDATPYPFTAAATPEGCAKLLRDTANAHRVLIDPCYETVPKFLTADELRRAVKALTEKP